MDGASVASSRATGLRNEQQPAAATISTPDRNASSKAVPDPEMPDWSGFQLAETLPNRSGGLTTAICIGSGRLNIVSDLTTISIDTGRVAPRGSQRYPFVDREVIQ